MKAENIVLIYSFVEGPVLKLTPQYKKCLRPKETSHVFRMEIKMTFSIELVRVGGVIPMNSFERNYFSGCLKSVRNNVTIHIITKEVRVKSDVLSKNLNMILAQRRDSLTWQENHEGEQLSSFSSFFFLLYHQCSYVV